MKTHLLRTSAIALIFACASGLGMAQQAPTMAQTPDQSGADSSMGKPQTAPAQAVPNADSLTSSLQNKASVKIPSPQTDTAQFNPAVFEKDKLPIFAWTFGLTDERERAAFQNVIAQNLGAKNTTGSASTESKVEGITPMPSELVPDSVQLSPLPDHLSDKIANPKAFKYARIGSDIVIADANNRAIVAVIKQ